MYVIEEVRPEGFFIVEKTAARRRYVSGPLTLKAAQEKKERLTAFLKTKSSGKER